VQNLNISLGKKDGEYQGMAGKMCHPNMSREESFSTGTLDHDSMKFMFTGGHGIIG
jgi:hypothetical protein